MNRLTVLLVFLSLATACSMGCRKGAETAAKPAEDELPCDKGTDPASPAEPNLGEYQPGVVSADVKALAQGNNQFAFDLYARLAKQDGNIAFSPYSISSALAMTYAGARGDTAEEMEQTLRFPLKGQSLHPVFADLSRGLLLGGNSPCRQLLVANSLWAQRGYPFRDEFMRVAHDDYHAEAKEVDYVHDAEGARHDINRWVEVQTKDKIQELLKPYILDELTRLVLVNAVYFQSKWANPFDVAYTKEEPFYLGKEEKLNVPMMHGGGNFRYFEDDKVQVVEVPYAGKRFSMVLILPRRVGDRAALDQAATEANVQDWLAKSSVYDVYLTLPKFTTRLDLSLRKELAAMGMPLAFSDKADFSEMTSEHAKPLQISAVVHQTYVEVSEEGTKAAAATAVVMAKIVVKAHAPPPQATFKADHAFLFLIQDRDTGSILFLGRVTRPAF